MNPFTSRMPMYSRIQLKILGQIQDGSLKPGQQLPTETELARQYQVSRITAKRALDELVRGGRAYRQQGRGTFVAQTQLHDISGFGSFSDDIRARGLTPGARVLAFKEIQPEAQIQARLQLERGEPVYLLKRLRLAEGEPVAVETAYLPCRLCRGLIDEDLNDHSLYAILTEKYQITPTWADAEFEARMATREEAALLKYKAGKPVLSALRLTFSANYDVIETVNSVYRGDRFTFYSGRLLIGG
ncbi:MAG TPA: GntR family transcriptional regulator [Streptosporangiaceae bacterium]|nr:GntR family transcriptional regulator [Streptosporangiaceae bacterium]